MLELQTEKMEVDAAVKAGNTVGTAVVLVAKQVMGELEAEEE